MSADQTNPGGSPPSYVHPTAVNVPPPSGPIPRTLPPRRIILEQSGGGLRKVILIMLVAALGLSVMFNFGLLGAYHSYVQTDPGLVEKLHSGSASGSDKIAIITLKGVIMEGDGFVKKQIDRVSRDPDVKAVVLRVDSPGGTVTGSHYIFYHLKKLRLQKKIPLVVSMGSLAASGGYYVSMAVGDTKDTIYAEPTTWTGSIGVIIPHYDISELLTKWNIKDDSIASGPLKQMMSPTRPPTPAEQAVVKELVKESFDRFKEVVGEGRPKLKNDSDLMAKATTGQVFSATQAQALGLVDQLGYLDDALKQAAKLSNLSLKEVRVIEYEKPQGLLDAVVSGSQSSEAAQPGLSAMLDLAAPRAYYLFSWLPSLVNRQ